MSETPILTPVDKAADLVPPAVFNTVRDYLTSRDIFVVKINPEFAGADDFCSNYGISKEHGANCVILRGERGSDYKMAACLSLVGRKLNINQVVRRFLGARRVTLAPLDDVLEQTNMEYGSITVVGLPNSWPILIEPDVIEVEKLFIGGGYRQSKLCLPGKSLLELPNVAVVPDLTIAAN